MTWGDYNHNMDEFPSPKASKHAISHAVTRRFGETDQPPLLWQPTIIYTLPSSGRCFIDCNWQAHKLPTSSIILTLLHFITKNLLDAAVIPLLMLLHPEARQQHQNERRARRGKALRCKTTSFCRHTLEDLWSFYRPILHHPAKYFTHDTKTIFVWLLLERKKGFKWLEGVIETFVAKISNRRTAQEFVRRSNNIIWPQETTLIKQFINYCSFHCSTCQLTRLICSPLTYLVILFTKYPNLVHQINVPVFVRRRGQEADLRWET